MSEPLSRSKQIESRSKSRCPKIYKSDSNPKQRGPSPLRITTTEVNIARTHNYGVKMRQAAKVTGTATAYLVMRNSFSFPGTHVLKILGSLWWNVAWMVLACELMGCFFTARCLTPQIPTRAARRKMPASLESLEAFKLSSDFAPPVEPPSGRKRLKIGADVLSPLRW